MAVARHGSDEPLHWELFDDGEALEEPLPETAAAEPLAALISAAERWPLSLREGDNPALFILDDTLRERLQEGGYWVSGPDKKGEP